MSAKYPISESKSTDVEISRGQAYAETRQRVNHESSENVSGGNKGVDEEICPPPKKGNKKEKAAVASESMAVTINKGSVAFLFFHG